MPGLPKCLSLTMLACTWLFSTSPDASWAQLSISLDDDVVRLQDGNKPPLVVKPGQSFGGQLTSRGFQGVMSGPAGTQAVTPAMTMANPFRDAPPAMPRPLKIKAGDLMLTLPMTAPAMNADRTAKPALTRQKLQTMRMLVRTKAPSAMQQVDKLLQSHSPDADLLQLKALLMLQAGKQREAAAFVYDAMAMDTTAGWDWAMLRSSLPDREAATMLSRLLQQDQRERPALEHDFLMAWWEHMLGHRPESLSMMQRAAQARPSDPVFQKMLSIWTEPAADASTAPQP